MSTKCSIIWNKSLDYEFHIYDDYDKDFYFLGIDGNIIKVKKEIIAKMVRDMIKGDIIFIKDYAEKNNKKKSREEKRHEETPTTYRN